MALPTSKTLRRIVSQGSTPVGVSSLSLEASRIAESTTAMPPAVWEVSRATENSTNYTVRVSGQPSSCKLDQLPREIFDQIIYHCKHEASFHGQIAIDHYPINDEWLPLKTLRLVNKRMNILVSSCLFKSITLYQHVGYWESLNNIANTPTLASHVEHLRLAHVGYVRQEGQESWNTLTADSRGHRGHFVEHPPARGPLAQWDFGAEASWERYRSWRDAETVMRNHEATKTAPQVSLNLLVNLRSIETIGLGALRTIKRKPWMRSNGLCKQRPGSRRYFATGLNDENTSRGVPPGARPYIPSIHLQTMMIALQTCGRDLHKLTVHRVQELWYINEPCLGLPSLEHLVIDSTHVRYHDWLEARIHKVSQWVLDLKSLKHLEIRQNPTAKNNPDICKILKNADWPKLRRLELTNTETPLASLENFVARHIEKLDYLSIIWPVIDTEDWAEFRSQFTYDWSTSYTRTTIHLTGDLCRPSVSNEPADTW